MGYRCARRKIATASGIALVAFLVAGGGVLAGHAAVGQNARPDAWAQPVASAALGNLYKVDDGLYRSRQPDRQGFEEARRKGIRTVINLRSSHTDAKLVDGLGLKLIEIPMNAWDLDEGRILAALRAIQTSPKPVLIHCEHGADRAGVVSAAYRVVVQGWSKDEAVAELKKGGFGFHRIYLNIPAFIKNLDVAKFRARLASPAPIPQQAQRPGGLE